MDKKQITVLVLLDLFKASDNTDHARLLHKLSIVETSSSTVNLFKSYLSSRCQYVRIDSTNSDIMLIIHGVPQGAILSPLLICIYQNDLPLAPSSCKLYVDDSKLFPAGRTGCSGHRKTGKGSRHSPVVLRESLTYKPRQKL